MPPSVVNRIKSKVKHVRTENVFELLEKLNRAAIELVKQKRPSVADMPSKMPKRVPVGPDHMIRYFFMDGLSVTEAERCTDNDVFCMAPVPPDDPRCAEFASLDDDTPRVTEDNGRLICTPYGSRQKMNFFHSPNSGRPRHRLICSAFHQLNGADGRRALQQVDKAQQDLRQAVKQVTGRLSHGSSRSGLG